MIGNLTGLQIEQKLSIKLTPSQLQTVEILQMSIAELQKKISDELLENPVLESATCNSDEDDDFSEPFLGADNPFENEHVDKYENYDRCDAYKNHFDNWDNSFVNSTGSSRVAEFESFYKRCETLREHLMKQLMDSVCKTTIRDAAEFIIYSLDNNGYLDISLEEIIQDSGHSAEEVQAALAIVRDMDPPGLAAWTLEECLRLQMNKQSTNYINTCKVIDSMLHDVATGDIRKISRALNISQEESADVISIIRTADPKPGARFSDGNVIHYVIPDVEIDIINGEAVVYMTDVKPSLKLNSYYCNLLKRSKDKEVKKYLNDKIDSANRLISNIEQRKHTIEKVTLAILERQPQFLEPGNRILEPLTMQQIADDLGLHVSTVSRAVREKYIRFPTATYPLKYFFTNEVSGVSRDNIYSKIKSIIASEDPSKPMSDQAISDILSKHGITISRRTVAKYRDSMGILPKSMRKVL